METLISSPAASEVRSVIKFLNAESIAPIEIHRQLCQETQRSSNFAWEKIPDWTPRRLCSKASQPLIILDLVDSEVSGTVPTLNISFKVHRVLPIRYSR
ncbi:hypothetical protein TNCV_1744761 [Trichonephila clavipes]|nr:hypothetical protein TNCV_1744761 [Trichonephila clavipes]